MAATPARQILDASLTERQFMDSVTKLATTCGWHWYHPWRSDHSVRGWPDLCLVRRERLIFAEIKSQKGAYGPGQEDWLARLEATGAETFTWRPSDWPEIEEVLR